MTDVESVASASRYSTLNVSAWRLRPLVIASALVVGAFAVALFYGGTFSALAAVVVLVDLCVQLLPWQTPRRLRSGRSLWLEATVCTAAPLTLAVFAVATRQPWAVQPGRWWWYAAAGALGAILIGLGGMNLRRLFSGEVAFLLGRTRPVHGWARIMTASVSPVGEEAVFRALAISAGSAVLPVGILGGLAFIARHHLPLDSAWRSTARHVGVEVVASAGLLLLTVASKSIYPALAAHTVNNLPTIILEFQRKGRHD